MKLYYSIVIVIVLTLSFDLKAQNYNMSNTTVNISCGSVINFYDSGGPSASYSTNANLSMVFCAPGGQNIYAQFSSFNLENTWDYLYVYNGPSMASPLLGAFTGGVSPGLISGATNCLTFVFVSDNSFNSPGWAATLGCGSPPISPPSASGLCSGSQPFCTGTTYTFPASQNTTAQSGPNYGCLLSAPNPAWYYMQIQNGGPLSISMASTAGVDIDYALWGPFSTLTNVCNQLTAAPISCSYSTAPNETATIANAIAGQYYILVITNFSNMPTNITFSQSGGSATTNCDILCNMTSFTAVPGVCIPATNTYNVSGSITFTNPPASGTLTITSSCGVSTTIPGPWVSPLSYTLTGLPSNGLACVLTASFSGDVLCNLNQSITAPASCLPQCTVSASNSGTACAGNSVSLNASAVSGATAYTWTGPNGYSAAGQNVVLTGTTALMTGTYTVTATGLATCSSTTTVNITALPVLSPVSNIVACSGNLVNIPSFTVSPSNAAVDWMNSNTSIGLAGSGVGNVSPFLSSSQGLSSSGNITLLPTFNGCSGLPINFNITVNTTPSSGALNNISLCEGSTVQAINFITNPNASVNWSNSNPGIGIAATGIGNIASFNATAGNATISYTPTLNGCIGSSQSFEIFAEVLPQIFLTAPSMVCQNVGPLTVGVNVLGGTWGGVANSSGIIDPGALPIGISDFSYNYSTANCTSAIAETIEIIPFPQITGNLFVCVNTALNLTASPPGGVWSGAVADASGTFNQSTSGTYSVSYSDITNTCTTSAEVIVQNEPVLNLNCPSYVCNTDAQINFNPSPPGGVWSGTGISSSGVYSPAQGSNPTVATYTYSNGVCTVTESSSIDVFTTPIIALNNPIGICVNNTTTALSASPIGGTWTVNGNASLANGVLVPSGPETITLIYSIAGQCPSSANQTMQIYALPTINAGADLAHCPGQSAGLTATGGNTYQWSPSTGLNTTSGASVVASVSTQTNYTVVGTDANGCVNSDQVAVSVFNNPIVTISGDNLLCEGESSDLTAVGANGYTWQPDLNVGSISNVSPNSTTTYTVLGTDVNGCSSSASFTVNVESINASPSVINSNDGNDFTWEFNAGSSGVNETYIWNPGDGSADIQTNVELTNYTYTSDILGTVTLNISTAACSEDFVFPVVISTIELIYPNIVTADGDGINDDFRLLNPNTTVVQAFENFSCKIFGRWGQELGEFNDLLGFWDPADFNTGTYFYIVEYDKVGGNETYKYEGSFYLKR